MAGDLEENQWKDWLKATFPQYFTNVKVLDIGSADINGINKSWFQNCEYIGLDVKEWANVDVVCKAHEYDAPSESFNVVLSTSELEHDMHWDKTLDKMETLLKPGGFMFFAASYMRATHGTEDRSPNDSLTTQIGDNKWAKFYKHIRIADVESVLNLHDIFSDYEIRYSKDKMTIFFWGIKEKNVV